MNIHQIAPLVLATSLFAGAGSVPLQEPPPATGAQENSLLGHMEGFKVHLKATAMALQDPDGRGAALTHIAELQRLALLAKLEQPANLAEVAEDEREAHATAFRRDLATVLREFVEMEIEVLDGNLEKAFARVIDPLFPLREAAHEKYQSEKG